MCRTTFALLAGSVAILASPSLAASPNDQVKACGGAHGPLIRSDKIKSPDIGQDAEAEVGQSIVSVLRADLYEAALTLKSEVRFGGSYVGAAYEVTVPAGDLQPVDTPKGREYRSSQATFKYKIEGKARGGFSAPDIALAVDPSDPSGLVGRVGFGFVKREAPIKGAAFTIEPCLLIGPTYFKRELIYSGVSKGTVTVTYREYAGDVARPAFSQELKYDLAEGDEIGFRGARFKVLAATNLGLRYRVVKPLED